MHKHHIIKAGSELQAGGKALIMLHGRGATAEDILSLASHLPVEDFALLAPQATNNTWYPYSFLAPRTDNEPWLTSALSLVQQVVDEATEAGIAPANIYFAGFSQGACLTLDFAGRNAQPYGGVMAFTGGLIGTSIDNSAYTGDFKKTPIFIGTSNPDMHVPVERVKSSAQLLQQLNGNVQLRIYPDMGHTITRQELEEATKWVFNNGQ